MKKVTKKAAAKKSPLKKSPIEKFIEKELEALDSVNCGFIYGLHHASVKAHTKEVLKRLSRIAKKIGRG